MDWLTQFMQQMQGMGGPAGAGSMGELGGGMGDPSVAPPPPPIQAPPVPTPPAVQPSPMIGGAPSQGTGQMDPMGGAGESAGLPSLGASLEQSPMNPGMPGGSPGGLPMQAGSGQAIGSPAPSAQPPGPGGGSALLQALRGVQAPPRPDVVKPSTPALPHQQAIQSGGLFQLLQHLGYPVGQGRPAPTLGGTVGIGRY